MIHILKQNYIILNMRFNIKNKGFVLILVAGGLTTAAFQNCSKVSFSENSPGPLSADGGPATSPAAPTTPTTPSNPTAPGTAPTIRQFQPALAVRDISCLACHATIKSNVLTDFGHGNPWFMNQNGDQSKYGDGHYLPNSWQSINQISGQIIVPVANVPDASVMAALPSGAPSPQLPMSIAKYLTNSSIKDWDANFTYQYWKRPEPTNLALTTYVTAGSGMQVVQEQNLVYIGAPTRQEILSLSTNTNSAPWVQEVGAASPGLAGLSLVSGANGSYVTNTGTVLCSGKDVVINATLLLKNLNIIAENNGCRLYVTGSVFIEGQINYINSGTQSDATTNLQITSSTSIILGVGIDGTVVNGNAQTQSNNPLQDRLLGDVRSNLLLRSAQTSSAYNTFAQNILNEGLAIGTMALPDATLVSSGGMVASSAAGQTREKIDYTHILLNAPLIHSRYLGTVTGVIVAESAEFSLGEFSFDFDPVFQTVPVLPALPKDILCAVQDTTKCNPAQL